MPSPNRPMTPMTQGLIIPPPPSESGIIINNKSHQRPSTPSTNIMDDKDVNDSEGIFTSNVIITLVTFKQLH
jgi:hypothetical protein